MALKRGVNGYSNNKLLHTPDYGSKANHTVQLSRPATVKLLSWLRLFIYLFEKTYCALPSGDQVQSSRRLGTWEASFHWKGGGSPT